MDRFEITIQRALSGNAPIAVEWARAGGSPAVHAAGELRLDREALNAERSVRAYGEILGRATFAGDIGDRFSEALADADDRLHVIINVADAAEALKELRWQRLCAEIDNSWQHLMLVRRTPFSLYVPSSSTGRFVPFGRSELRTLIVAASPLCILETQGLQPFDVQAAITAVKGSLGEGMAYHVLADVPGADGPPTFAALMSAISSGRFPMIHFICHGAVREDTESSPPQRVTFLYLADANGHTDPVDGERLIRELAHLKGSYGLPHFAFLAACETAGPTANGAYGGLAEQFARDLGMPAVLAMTAPISTDTANSLARELYKGASAHGEIDRALVEACAGLAESVDVTVPALYSRLAGLPLFSDAIPPLQELSPQQIDKGLASAERLLAERAPILIRDPETNDGPRRGFASLQGALRRLSGIENVALSPTMREERRRALDEIEAICIEALDMPFAALAVGQSPPLYDPRQPFPGLCPFRAKNRAFFFGRESRIAELQGSLAEHPFLAVLGSSGSGKSSVVLAGLVPALVAASDDPGATLERDFRPGDEPLERLDETLQKLGGSPGVIVVDQFEEVFTLCRDETKRTAFFERLLALPPERPVVLTMRSDFQRDCKPYSALWAAIEAHQQPIEPMNEDELQKAIEQQATEADLRFEADLAATIVDQVRGEPGAMTLLQQALLELWNRRHGRWLLADEYRAQKGVEGVIARTAEAVYNELTEPDKERMRDIFVRLTRLDEEAAAGGERRDRRRRVTLEELTPVGGDVAATKALVWRLANEGLIVTSSTLEEPSAGPADSAPETAPAAALEPAAASLSAVSNANAPTTLTAPAPDGAAEAQRS